jgi:hypothetical protein
MATIGESVHVAVAPEYFRNPGRRSPSNRPDMARCTMVAIDVPALLPGLFWNWICAIMPRVARSIIPRIKKSLRDRGLATTLRRSFLLPIHLLEEHRSARSLCPDGCQSEFDRVHGVDTGGRFEGWIYLSDLDIPSPNWIDGNDYAAIEPERFNRVLASFDVPFENLTFIDFGSGKGRALLLASEYPFKSIIVWSSHRNCTAPPKKIFADIILQTRSAETFDHCM